jgi:hypothetical protein
MAKGQVSKPVILVIAIAIILVLVVTTPGWKDIFGLNGSEQLLLYGALGAGIIGIIVFAMNSK